MSRDRYNSEAELGQGLQNGDPEAVTAFVDGFFPGIRNVLGSFMYAEGGAEPSELDDEAIEVAYRVVKALAGNKPQTNLAGYVKRSAVNAGRDWRKRKRKEFEVETGGEASELARQDVHSDLHAEATFHPHPAVAMSPEILILLTNAQAVLKPEQRNLLDLRAQGFEYGEIGAMIGDVRKPVKDATWRQRHKRALDAFSEECHRLVDEHPELKPLLAAAEERAYARSPKPSSKGNE